MILIAFLCTDLQLVKRFEPLVKKVSCSKKVLIVLPSLVIIQVRYEVKTNNAVRITIFYGGRDEGPDKNFWQDNL